VLYQECDQEGPARIGRPTHDDGPWKLDYILSNQARRWCTVADSAYSDHHVVIESLSAP
jgi:hypothetical protein